MAIHPAVYLRRETDDGHWTQSRNKRKQESDDEEDEKTPATVTPLKSKSSLASRSAFKTPFRSPLMSSPLTEPKLLPSPLSGKSPAPTSKAGRQLGGLSKSEKKTIVDPAVLKVKIVELRAKELKMDEEIAELEDAGLDEKDLQKIMNQLHDYNELKDAAQTTFGRLANIRQCMIRDVYEDLGLELED